MGPPRWQTCCKSVANVRQRCGKGGAVVWRSGRRCGQEKAYIIDVSRLPQGNAAAWARLGSQQACRASGPCLGLPSSGSSVASKGSTTMAQNAPKTASHPALG
eukprot:3135527-Alexandrium_andersonii.AAC.1